MMTKKKRGFTIVELVIVIAVIGILAAVLIPTFTGLVEEAKKSNDREIVYYLNQAVVRVETDRAVAGKTEKAPTMHETLEAMDEKGFGVAKLTPTSNECDIIWDSTTNRFALIDKNGVVVAYDENVAKPNTTTGKVNLWKVYEAVPDTSNPATSEGYSIYLKGTGVKGAVSVTGVGLDVGDNEGITSVNYTNTSSAKNVVIRTNGDQTSLNVYAPADTVNFYGFAKAIYVADVAPDSLHVFGSVSALAIKEGHVDIENTGIVFDIVQFGDKSSAPGNSGTISNKGYIAETSYSRHTTAPTEQQIEAAQALINNNPESTKNVGGDYEIASLEQLEAFRDAVNSGHTFEGLTAKLTANITLRNGWVPIGEGNRSSYATNKNYDSLYTGTAFRGEFNGNNKTIDNLNNIGFTPTSNRISGDKEYVYGLFALTATGANIHDLTLTNVDIDGTRYNINGVVADSVGALVGASMGGISVNNVTVEGSVKANDAVGGIIGRCYNKDGIELYDNNSQRIAKEVSLTNCSNKASVIGNNEAGCKTAGCFGYISDNSIGYFKITVTGNKNYGIVTGHESYISSIAVLDQAFFTHEGTTITGTNAGKAGRSYTVNTNKAGTNDSNLVDCNTLTFNEWSGGLSVVVIK